MKLAVKGLDTVRPSLNLTHLWHLKISNNRVWSIPEKGIEIQKPFSESTSRVLPVLNFYDIEEELGQSFW